MDAMIATGVIVAVWFLFIERHVDDED